MDPFVLFPIAAVILVAVPFVSRVVSVAAEWRREAVVALPACRAGCLGGSGVSDVGLCCVCQAECDAEVAAVLNPYAALEIRAGDVEPFHAYSVAEVDAKMLREYCRGRQ